MILYKNERVSIHQSNIIMLDTNEGGVIYVHGHIYTQAIKISGMFEGDLDKLKKSLAIGENQTTAIKYFNNNAPEPLHMFAPFLGLVSKNIKLSENLRELCGVLHMLSTTINFSDYVSLVQPIRPETIIEDSVIMSYEQEWESMDFKLKLEEINLETIESKNPHNTEEEERIDLLLERIGGNYQ